MYLATDIVGNYLEFWRFFNAIASDEEKLCKSHLDKWSRTKGLLMECLQAS